MQKGNRRNLGPNALKPNMALLDRGSSHFGFWESLGTF